MNIIELLSQRLSTLKETQTELELLIEPLQSCKEEIVLVERMMALDDIEPSGVRSAQPISTPPAVVVETPPVEPTTPRPPLRKHTAEELFRLEGRIV